MGEILDIYEFLRSFTKLYEALRSFTKLYELLSLNCYEICSIEVFYNTICYDMKRYEDKYVSMSKVYFYI